MSAYAGEGGSPVPLTEAQISAAGDTRYSKKDGSNITDPSTYKFNLGITTKVKSANYTVDSGDANAIIYATTSLTLALTAAATVGAYFTFDIVNAASAGNPITIDPNSTETVNGSATIKVFPGERATLVCDGSNWRAFGLAPLVLLSTLSTSSGSSLIFTSLFDPTFTCFEVRGSRLLSAAPTDLQMQISIDGGSTWKTGSTDYRQNYALMDQGGTNTGNSITGSSISLCQISGGSMASFEMNLYDLNWTTNNKTSHQRQAGSATAGLRYMDSVAWFVGAGASAVNGLKYFPNSGTISGEIKLYGRR